MLVVPVSFLASSPVSVFSRLSWEFSQLKVQREREWTKLTLTSRDNPPVRGCSLKSANLTRCWPHYEEITSPEHLCGANGFHGKQNCGHKQLNHRSDFPCGVQGSPWRWSSAQLHLTLVSFMKLAAWVAPGHHHAPSSSFLASLLFSFYALIQSLLPFLTPPSHPVWCYVMLRKCASAREQLQHQRRAGIKAGVGGGGVHYAWPPTQLQWSSANTPIL